MQTFLTVYEEGKVSSSWLTKGLQLLSSVLLGVNTFKAAWKSAPDAATALAAANNTTVEALKARLRLAGVDPDAYLDTLTNNVNEAGGIDNMSADDINQASAAAQTTAQDSSQKLWLFAGLALILVLGLGSGKRARRYVAGRVGSMYRRWRSRPRRGRRRR